LPTTIATARAEAAEWGQALRGGLSAPGQLRTHDAALSLLFAAELAAFFKLGEFLGRGCTFFGYWP
jgi:Mitochondrial ATP synthase g subunit